MKKSPKSLSKSIAALDIGSTKIACAIAHIDDKRTIQVNGVGLQASQGIKGSTIVDMEALESSILKCIQSAEEMAQHTIHEVVVNIPGIHLTSRLTNASLNIAGHPVDTSDIHKALSLAREECVKGGAEVIHALPVAFAIDENREILDPRGMYGNKLDMTVHTLTAALGPVKNIVTCIGKCHLDVAGMVASPLASAVSTLVEDEKDLGCVLLDMGGGSTSITVFANGNMVFSDTIPVGGMHVTNDIAQCLSTPVVHAERLKTLYGTLSPSPASDNEMILVPQIGDEFSAHANQIPKSMLAEIIYPRVEEILEIVKGRLEKAGFSTRAGGRLVLTGGASQLAGIREVAAFILNKQSRLGRPLHIQGLKENAGGPAFSTCAGLLDFAMRENKTAAKSPKTKKSMFGRVGLWLRDNL